MTTGLESGYIICWEGSRYAMMNKYSNLRLFRYASAARLASNSISATSWTLKSRGGIGPGVGGFFSKYFRNRACMNIAIRSVRSNTEGSDKKDEGRMDMVGMKGFLVRSPRVKFASFVASCHWPVGTIINGLMFRVHLDDSMILTLMGYLLSLCLKLIKG